MLDSRYRINKPEVVFEVMDDELVAIHLGTGSYYHANQIGSFIWSSLQSGNSILEVANILGKHYKLDTEKSTKITLAYVQKLVSEKLVVRLEKKSKKVVALTMAVPQTKFVIPTLKKHQDMKELLLLDPIHDIGEESWPLEKVA